MKLDPYSFKIIKHNYFQYILKYQKWCLLLLLILILLIPLASNFINDNPLLMGEESYYHLSNSEEVSLKNLSYFPLHLINSLIGSGSVLIPILLAVASLFLFYELAKKLKLSERFTFFFLLILFFTPSFIFTYSTLSACSFFIFLLLCGFVLLTLKNKYLSYLSVLPFALAAFFDAFSTIFLLTLLFIFIKKHKEKKYLIIFSTTLLFFLLNLIFLTQPFIFGPFQAQGAVLNLITDLGSLSGISFFTLLAAFIGFTISWKKKNFYLAYVFLIPLLIIYYFNIQILFLLTLPLTFFAALGIIKLFEIKWELNTLKKFTLLLLILGITFSAISYLDRIIPNTPTHDQFEVLSWIKENTAQNSIIFSTPENGYYIRYIAQRQPFYLSHEKNNLKKNITKSILNSIYVHELTPLLEENKINFLYITSQMKKELPQDYGLLFLLKNEKFKLIHSHEETEVWVFTAEK